MSGGAEDPSALLLRLPPATMSRLVAALETGRLRLPATDAALSAALGSTPPPGVGAALDVMHSLGTPTAAAAVWIRGLAAAAAGPRLPELVWSGPRLPGVHARDTRSVFERLLRNAKESVWLSTYAYHDGQEAFRMLAKRMDAVPGLVVHVLLNVHRPWGDKRPAKDCLADFTKQFFAYDWPGTRRPLVHYDPRSLLDEGKAVHHAKALVVDDQRLLVTSANLTEAAFDRNHELGLFVEDAALARAAAEHLRLLLKHGRMKPLPPP